MITLLWDSGTGVERSSSIEKLPALLAETSRPFWLDLEAPPEDEFALLETVFHFHPLAIEDAKNPHQRPKVDEYDEFSFFAVDAVTLDEETLSQTPINREAGLNMVQAKQVAVFLGGNYLVTIHTEPIAAVRAIRDICNQNHRILKNGADHVLHTLLDVLVDSYFPMLDTLEEAISDLEDHIIEQPNEDDLEATFLLKRALTRLRRHVAPLREVMQTLMTRDFPGIQPNILPYLRDVDDHLFRIYETLDLHRDLTSNLLDVYLSQKSNELNIVMRKLAATSLLFLPLTFLTGFFGMNFARMPWANSSPWLWLGVMGAIAVGIFWWLRRRRWV